MSFHRPLSLGLLLAAGLSGCATKSDSMLVHESFNSENTYSRNFDVPPAAACDAARSALLSQGYIVARADGASVEGSKNFQPREDSHEQLDLRISCVAQGADKSWVFVSALQDRYALKKSPTSASVGVSVLGSLSLPIGSTDDSLVKVASVTVQDAKFYQNFFERLRAYLPPPAPAKQPAKPAAPAVPAVETEPATAAAAAAAVELAPAAPQSDTPALSTPVVPAAATATPTATPQAADNNP